MPWWQREGVISRVLAVAGVGVTLIGVLMLLVLAAQAGFFGPVARVVAGAALSVGLVGAGWRVFGRPGGRVGGIALVATGIAGAYLDVVAVTGYYEWVPTGVGLVLALAVALAGVGMAVRWQSQPLAVGVVLGAAILSPALTTELSLLGFLVVLQAAGVPVQLRRAWPVLHIARTLPVVLATLTMVAVTGLDAAISDTEAKNTIGLLLAALACAVIGLLGAVLAVRHRRTDITASVTIVLTALPVLATAMLFDRVPAAAITGGFASVLLALAATALMRGPASSGPAVSGPAGSGLAVSGPAGSGLAASGPAGSGRAPSGSTVTGAVPVPAMPGSAIPGSTRFGLPSHTTLVSALTGAVALVQTCVTGTGAHPHLLPTALSTVALAFLAVAATTRNRVAAALGAAFALLGALTLLTIASPETLGLHRLADQHLDLATALAAVLGAGTAAMTAWTVARLPRDTDTTLVTAAWVVASLAGLYYVLVTAVSLGVTLGTPDGFIIGHSLATIIWMIVATAAVFYGLRRLTTAPATAKVYLVTGLLVAAAALAKLFLFDLATLSGIIRVAAFLAVGILLLLTGTRYARAFADSTHTEPKG
ncbi:DUF2339 domain-containing protein [Nocardia sp. AG03]|uniref:DUF2339 domain-containing protein n=1 Tax=Nocardia sp. AG03 TaxID=3025312 RepID=UPI002418966F|nr:DUF2339 domain-containing protein [Nocardia sp. AG03]